MTEPAHPRPEDRDDDLHPEEPAAGVDDVIETFDREPPEHPVSEANAPAPPG